jgi:hypothetical protein
LSLRCWQGMLYKKAPLLKYSETEERASVYEEPFTLTKQQQYKKLNTSPKKYKKTKKKKRMSVKRKANLNGLVQIKVAKNDQIDPHFDFVSKDIDWNANIPKQLLKYTHVQVLEPTYSLTTNNSSYLDKTDVTFELPPFGTFLPGNLTRFYVEGIFEKRTATDVDWDPIPSAEASQVILSPNWFDKLIEEIKLISEDGATMSLNDEPMYISPYINEMLYAHMDSELKTYLCKEDCHPGNGVTLTRSKWDFEGEDWKKYAPSIFKGEAFQFSYIPLNFWPFFQNGKFILDDEHPPRAINLALFQHGKVVIKFNTLFKKGNNIFRKKEGNETEYRVRITNIKLALEMAEDYKNPFPTNGILKYLGTSKKVKECTIQDNTAIIKFENMTLPNSLLFFFLPKNAISGILSYKDETENGGFRKHSLDHIQVRFNMQDLYCTNTDRDAYLGLEDALNLENHIKFPIAGIPVDKNKTTLNQLLDDGTNYAFPHTYLRLSPGYHQRLLPATGKTDHLQDPGILEIKLTFSNNATINKDLAVFVYAFYDDFIHVIADLKKKTFYNPRMNKAINSAI